MGHYGYDALRKIVVGFHPDILCGEVRPKDWRRTQCGKAKGYCGPTEYRRCLIPLCRERGIVFVPVDSYDDADIGLSNTGNVSAAEKKLDQIMLSLVKRKELGLGAVTDPALSYVIKAKHALAAQSRPEVESKTWDRRNKRIVRRVTQVVSKNPGKRILVTIGLEHVPFISDALANNPHFDLVSPIDSS